MPSPNRLAAVTVCGAALAAAATAPAPALAAPVATTVADEATQSVDPFVERVVRDHERAVDRHVRLHRENARLRGVAPHRDRRRALADWTVAHVRVANRRMRRENARLERAARAASASSGAGAGATSAASAPSGTSADLQAIARCESGGNPGAVGGGGAYRGKYQFSPSTWAAYGGSGDPASAPEAEQDRVAAAAYAAEGSAPWPVCGR